MEVIPEELRVIKVIHQLRNEGVSLRGISKRLAEISVTTRTGRAFLPIQIDRILKASPPGMDATTDSTERHQQPSGAQGEAHE